MNEFKYYLTNNFEKAIALKENFKKLEKQPWNSLTVILELLVQIGHSFNIQENNSSINEKNRKINNIGDELSDCLLQISYLSYLEKINFDNIEDYADYKYDKLEGLLILTGQLTEAMLEKYEYRFDKKHEDYEDKNSFIKDRIIKMFLIIFNYAEIHNININEEFVSMIIDANNFIERKNANGNN